MDQPIAVLAFSGGLATSFCVPWLQEQGYAVVTVTVGELVFQTGMVGYQETMSDPSYAGQLRMFTYPLVGNYGTGPAMQQSATIQARGVILRDLLPSGGHRDSHGALSDLLAGYLHALGPHLRRHPVLVDQFLEGAIEVDVDGIADGQAAFLVLMEQIDPAGVHSGDSTCVYPPQTLSPIVQERIRSYTRRLVISLGIGGLINVQYAVQAGTVYLLEVNARASRTVPFASKATGIPPARLATRLILGAKLADLDLRPDPRFGAVAVKTVVFPFNKFPLLERVLGPEMQSTGEAMGSAATFAEALAKAQVAAGHRPAV